MDPVEDAIDNALGSMANGISQQPTPAQARAALLRGQPLPAASAAGAPQMSPQGGGASGSWGPPQPPGGASGSWGPPQPAQVPFDPMRPLQRSVAMQRTRTQTMPPVVNQPQAVTPPPEMTPPVQQAPNDALTQQGQALDAREKALLGQMETMSGPVDHSKGQEVYDKRVEAGNRSMLLALAAAQAGPGFEAFQQHALKQAAERQAPMKVAGGEFTPEGFIEDSQYVYNKRMTVLQAQLAQVTNLRNANITEASKQEMRKREDVIRQEMAQMQLGFQRSQAEANRALQAQIANQASADRRYGVDERRATADAAAAAKGKGQVDPQHLIDLVGEARQYLPKATSSGLGRRVDQTAAFFGESTGGAQASAALDTIGGQLVMAQPRMEGPQSDKDVLLYRQMAGDVANRDLPIATRAAALDAIEKVAQKYKSGEFVPAQRPPGAAPRATTPPTSPGLPAGWSVTTR